MLIQSTPKMKTIELYDFYFTGGATLPITLDEAAGDTIQITKDAILVHNVEKPDFRNPDITFPAVDVTIFTDKLLHFHHSTKKVDVEAIKKLTTDWVNEVNRQKAAQLVN